MTSHIPKYIIIMLCIVAVIGTFSAQPVKAEPIPPTASPNYFYNRETAFIINYAFDAVNGGIYLAVRPDGQALPALEMSGDIWGVPAALFGNNPMLGTDKSLYGHATCIRYFIAEYQRVSYLESIGEPGLANLNAALSAVGGTPLGSPEALLGFATSCADFVIDNLVIDRVDDGIPEEPWNAVPGIPVSPDIGDVDIPNRVFYWSAVSRDASERYVDDTLQQIAEQPTAPRVESIVPWTMVELSLALQSAGVGGSAQYRNHAIEWWDWRQTTADTLPDFNNTSPPPPDDANACPDGNGLNNCIAGGGRDVFYPTLGYILGGTYRTQAIAEANAILGTGTAPNLPFPREKALQDSTYVAGYARGVMFATSEQQALGGVASRDQWWDFGNNPARLIADFSNPGASAPLNNLSQPFTHYSGREILAGTQRALWFYYTFGENPNQAFPAVGTFDDPVEMLEGVLGLWDYTNEQLWDTVDGQEAWFESSQQLYKPCFSAGTDLPIGDWAGPNIVDKIHTVNGDNSATVNVVGVTDDSFAYLSWEFRGAGVTDVDVVYSVDDGASWTSIPAAPSTGNNFQATIPPQPDGTRVYYYARAQDAFNNNTAFPSGAEVWNDSGETLSQNIGASQTYVIGQVVAEASNVENESGVVAAGDLTISKTVFPPIAGSGDTVEWTINISNPSGSDIAGLSVTDTIPNELTVVSATASLGTVSIDAQNVTVVIDNLPAGASATLTISTRINDGVAGVIVTNSVRNISASLIIVDQLPNTGETPWWHPCRLVRMCG